MENLIFIIWMLGYPLVLTLDRYVNEYLLEKTSDSWTDGFASFVIMFIYIFVGFILYK